MESCVSSVKNRSVFVRNMNIFYKGEYSRVCHRIAYEGSEGEKYSSTLSLILVLEGVGG
jgi:hypothetical protein